MHFLLKVKERKGDKTTNNDLNHSDVLVNWKVPRPFFAGDIGDIQRLQVQSASECKVPDERGKGNDLERVCEPLFGSKAKPLPPKQSVKFECKIWSEITKKFAKKCLDASSLWRGKKISA